MKNYKTTHYNNYNNLEIISLGYDLQFDIVISLNKEQFKQYNINIKEANKIEDIKNILNKDIISFTNLISNSFILNMSLFINRASDITHFIKYIIPFSYDFIPKYSFLSKLINTIFGYEGINIIQISITELKPNIRLFEN